MDDDLPLDAFDRELLAQLEERNQHAPSQSDPFVTPPAARGVIDRPMRNLLDSYDLPPVATPAQHRGSSSSDSALPSSPLMRYFRPKRDETSARVCPTVSKARSWQTKFDSHWIPGSSPEEAVPVSSPSMPRQISLNHAPPVVQGIHLIPTSDLPDRFRALFPFPLFNAIQSKCFQHVYQNDYNVVVSAPTGSGKTVVMELAICRLMNSLKDGLFKVIYQAPTRSLCAERFRDWSSKLNLLGLQCAELTGDTDYTQLRAIQTASIIITTPEKWDSMTRKWRDHARLMQLVKLFLIDEVHVLNETRGAVLEAVVSRMKSVGSNVRFIALSATVPNSEDVAIWLGKDSTLQHLPAHRERFGEEFRPVKLQKFVYGYQSNGNDFAFDRICNTKLPEVIAKHSKRKPLIIFCCTRNSAITTSKDLANLWSNTATHRRLWSAGKTLPSLKNSDLRTVVAAGVAFHHAGLDAEDRRAIENAFLNGKISIICSTSTLAVGINLPCHLVIVKNTVCWQDGGCKEYSDLEMMQMLGRAGRPQFDNEAVAVILTRKERAPYYERLVAGTQPLESCLHLNLIDHLNAEIGLGTVTDADSAVKWLAGTFLFVRMRRNPTHYKLREGADRRDEDEMLRQICAKDITLLRECELVSGVGGKLKSTAFGDAMAKYYVKFETMKIIMSLPPRSKISELLSAIAQADEFHDIRFKASERSLYKEINRANGIRFPIKVDVAQQAHKISLLIQSELGAVDFPSTEQFQKHKLQFQQDKALVFNHVIRLIRCIIDCQIHKEDAVAVRNALTLARSLAARAWEDSPLQIKQLDQIGIVAVRKLASAGITSIAELEDTEAQRIDMILSKNPPFGMKLLNRLAEFPKLQVTIKMAGAPTKQGKVVKVNFRASIGFLNEKFPAFFQRRPVYVCFLAELCDGRLLDFRRMNASKLQNRQEILLSAEVTSSVQHISCFVSCDDIAGTEQHAVLKPDVPNSWFSGNSSTLDQKPAMNSSRRRTNEGTGAISTSKSVKAVREIIEVDDFQDEDVFTGSSDVDWQMLDIPIQSENNKHTRVAPAKDNKVPCDEEDQPIRLPNGKWKCNHRCKDKTACKHFCCRDGLDRPPKISKSASAGSTHRQQKDTPLAMTPSNSKRQNNSGNRLDDDEFDDDLADILDMTQTVRSNHFVTVNHSQPARNKSSKSERLARLDLMSMQSATVPKSQQSRGKEPAQTQKKRKHSSSDYEDEELERLLAPSVRSVSSNHDPHVSDGCNKKAWPDHRNDKNVDSQGAPSPRADSSGASIEPEDSLMMLTSLPAANKRRDTDVYDSLSEPFTSEHEIPDRDTAPVQDRQNAQMVTADNRNLASKQDLQQSVQTVSDEAKIDALILEEFGGFVNFID